ncbi:nonsense-mediated mRNA decay protein [Tubulinosema ratisbonensis]|uniref:60S ribosomal export protein NMD3 n=1 Tax=Tubulinosema ratisbonensis TaxID=291195 RepID=A0A437ANT1_9MICR|nr:nonsense-mediated mRNA decay protein [Tubulinosema ratisbonensis]
MIQCCKCGTLTQPSILNMCSFCSTVHTDISLTIKKHIIIKHCRKCTRYLFPPKAWLFFHNQNDFINYLIKINTTLKHLNIISADLVYDKENTKNIILVINFVKVNYLNEQIVNENKLEIVYKLAFSQCKECAKMEDSQFWQSLVQVRQKNSDKKTFKQLEEIISKSNLNLGTINKCKNGLDFQFSDLITATKFVNFLKNNIVCKVDSSNKLISQDRKSNLNYFKNTFSVQICPFNKNDLISVTKEISHSFNVNDRLLVLKVSTELKLLDPISFKIIRINNSFFWKNADKFTILCTKISAKEFDIHEKILSDLPGIGKYKSCDLFVNDGNDTFHTKCHLANFVKEGDIVLGYNLKILNLEIKEGFTVYIFKKKPSKSEKKLNLENLEI